MYTCTRYFYHYEQVSEFKRTCFILLGSILLYVLISLKIGIL